MALPLSSSRVPSKFDLIAQAWQNAQACWSPYLRLNPPKIVQATANQPRFLAQVHLKQQQIQVDLEWLHERQLSSHLTMLLAHEIGHLIYSPGSLEIYTRMLVYTHAALQSEQIQLSVLAPIANQTQQTTQARIILNAYLDLLVNHRLFLNQYPILGLLQAITPSKPGKFSHWQGQIYGLLWDMPALFSGSDPSLNETPTSDLALLAADLIELCDKSFETGIDAFTRLAYACLDQQEPHLPDLALDAQSISAGWGFASKAQSTGSVQQLLTQVGLEIPAPQYLEPQVLPALFSEPHPNPEQGKALRVQYYRERVWPWIKSRPRRAQHAWSPEAPQELTSWQLDDPIQEVDWAESLSRSPRLIPGLTTFRRKPDHQTVATGQEKSFSHLDLYLDTSGSLADPNQIYSELVSAAYLLTLTALKRRIPVRVTRWSGEDQIQSTAFSLDEKQLLSALLHYSGGATALPLQSLTQRYSGTRSEQRLEKTHRIILLSDEGSLNWLQKYPEHTSAWEGIAQAAKGGAWLLLDWLEGQTLPARQSQWRLLALDTNQPDKVLQAI